MKSTPRTTSLNEPDIRPARNHAEAEEIGSLLLEEIAHPGFIPGPEFVWQGQGFLRPTLIGAWSQNVPQTTVWQPSHTVTQSHRLSDHSDCS